MKAVAYERATPAQRRRAHGALAGHCGLDARAWHLAAATVGPDAEVADLLDGAARRAIARGAHSAAADALQRAAGFSEDAETRFRRLYGAALAAAIGGAYDRCAAMLEPLAEIDDPLLRANIRHTLAVVTMTGGIGVAPDAHARLQRRGRAILPIDPAAAAAMLADAALLAGVSGQLSAGAPAARRAAAVLPDNASPMIRCRVHALSGISVALTGDAGDARESLDEAGRLLAEIDSLSPGTQSAVLGLHARVCTGQERALQTEIARLIEMARKTDTFGLLPYLLGVSADVAYRVGDWESGRDVTRRRWRLRRSTGSAASSRSVWSISGRLRAARGDDGAGQGRARARHRHRAGGRLGDGDRLGPGRARLPRARDAAARKRRSPSSSRSRPRPRSPAWRTRPSCPGLPTWWRPTSGPAAMADAELASASLTRRAERAGVALALAFAARCRGLVEEWTSKPTSTRPSPSTTAPMPRSRPRAPCSPTARACTAPAAEWMAASGCARRWRSSSGSEPGHGSSAPTRSCGRRARSAASRSPTPIELSAQEVRVAMAVAEGATNKQVAAGLFLSPKTIDFHLGRVYRKLGIHSRTELAALVAKGALGDPPGESKRRRQA